MKYNKKTFPQNQGQTAFGRLESQRRFECGSVALTIFVCVVLFFGLPINHVSAQGYNSSATENSSETTPHPAVVRIIAKPFYGSGTLIAKKTNYGFIITNWHVVCDSNGFVTVRFPDKREFPAAVIAVDDRWDLALLVIDEPKGVNPVAIAPTIPRIGESYWAAGYRGDGTYRIRGGRCLTFQSPEPDLAEPELIDIGVPAEGGDSGGPIFNNKWELSGVLFGSDSVTTVASHCGRVIKFLEQAAPQVAKLPANPTSVLQAATQSRQSILQRGSAALGDSNDYETFSVVVGPGTSQSSVSSSTSFGGSSIRPRNKSQSPQTQIVTRKKRHGFMNIQYEPATTAIGNMQLAAGSTGTTTTGTPPASSRPWSGIGSQTGSTIAASNSATSTGNSLGAGSTAALPTTGYAAAYPTNTGSNSGTSGTGYESIPSNGFALAPQATQSSQTPATSASQSWSSQPSASQYDTSRTGNNYGFSDTAGISPSARSSANATSMVGNANTYGNQATTGGYGLNNQSGSTARVSQTTAAATPSPGYTASGGFGNTSTGRQPGAGTTSERSSDTGNGFSSFQRKNETTPGGTRTNTPNSSNYGNRSNSTDNYYNTYGDNSSSRSASGGVAGNDRSRNSWNNNDWADDEMSARYALDSSEMRADDYSPKYAEEYSGEAETDHTSTAASSKFDAIKIVIAILVIFFILFHTIKTMAIAEEKAR